MIINKIKRIFFPNANNNADDQVFDYDSGFDMTLKNKLVYYLVVLVGGNDADKISENIARVVSIATKNDANCEIVSSLIVVEFGALELQQSEQDLIEQQNSFIHSLKKSQVSDFRAVYGVANVSVGNVGTPLRRAYTIILPEFHHLLKQVNELKIGEIKEINGIK